MTILGYARVSTVHQSPDMQIEALRTAGAERIWTEQAPAAGMSDPNLLPSWPTHAQDAVLGSCGAES